MAGSGPAAVQFLFRGGAKLLDSSASKDIKADLVTGTKRGGRDRIQLMMRDQLQTVRQQKQQMR